MGVCPPPHTHTHNVEQTDTCENITYADVEKSFFFISQRSVVQFKNMFLADSDWIVSSVVTDVEDRLDKLGYERLNAKLQVYLFSDIE